MSADVVEPELRGQTVVVIGGSAGIGLETARKARAFDANDSAALKRFFQGIEDQIDHVMVTAGQPHLGWVR